MTDYVNRANEKQTFSNFITWGYMAVVLQHPLTPLCQFAWPTTSWLNRCCSQILGTFLKQRTVDCGIIGSEKIFLVHLASYSSSTLLRRPIPSQVFVNICMPSCLILYTCGHGRDWNTWFQQLGWTSKYFWQYSVPSLKDNNN